VNKDVYIVGNNSNSSSFSAVKRVGRLTVLCSRQPTFVSEISHRYNWVYYNLMSMVVSCKRLVLLTSHYTFDIFCCMHVVYSRLTASYGIVFKITDPSSRPLDYAKIYPCCSHFQERMLQKWSARPRVGIKLSFHSPVSRTLRIS